ncbi:OmpA family protein [Robiginitalea sp. SC105]|uniref:OmpA family protein n=1 Tax=Robiginitalea sp. SC105 TaxID=2762332 RepID=UPI00163A5F61|nr:OmpA family protein [Robiginitalea sp. SC105]MBC2840316.1 OmpA family protein [Robiginitalea sp. SC105]
MKYCTCLLGLLALTLPTAAFSQDSIPELTARDSMVTSYWLAGIGINIVDDSGDAFNDFTTMRDQWNMVPFPSRINFGRYFRSGLGLELIGTYNRYKAGNMIDGITIADDIPYWAVDSRLSYDLNKLVGETGFFDPYVGVGIGYTDSNNLPRGTYNAVIGFRIWFSEHWGVDLSSSGKWSFGNEASNHIQHGAGVAFRFGVEKELNKRGEEKLALLAEQQRVADSLEAARRAEEEAREIAERLEREKEAALLAAAEMARQEEAARQQEAVARSVESLGNIYFAFDSYFLNDASKATLQQLSGIMKEHGDIRVRIEAHTDARGPESYNQGLSERRAESARQFLIEQGLSPDRIRAIGHGETLIVNGCTDGVRCSEAQHRENRREHFSVIQD